MKQQSSNFNFSQKLKKEYLSSYTYNSNNSLQNPKKTSRQKLKHSKKKTFQKMFLLSIFTFPRKPGRTVALAFSGDVFALELPGPRRRPCLGGGKTPQKSQKLRNFHEFPQTKMEQLPKFPKKSKHFSKPNWENSPKFSPLLHFREPYPVSPLTPSEVSFGVASPGVMSGEKDEETCEKTGKTWKKQEQILKNGKKLWKRKTNMEKNMKKLYGNKLLPALRPYDSTPTLSYSLLPKKTGELP